MFDKELVSAGIDAFDDAFAGRLLGCLCDNGSLHHALCCSVCCATHDNDGHGEYHCEFGCAETTILHRHLLLSLS